MNSKLRTTGQAANAARITRATLQEWIRRGKFRDAPETQLRNGRGVRLWTDADIARLKARKREIYKTGKVGRPRKRA